VVTLASKTLLVNSYASIFGRLTTGDNFSWLVM